LAQNLIDLPEAEERDERDNHHERLRENLDRYLQGSCCGETGSTPGTQCVTFCAAVATQPMACHMNPNRPVFTS
jgi:hypothetical protein